MDLFGAQPASRMPGLGGMPARSFGLLSSSTAAPLNVPAGQADLFDMSSVAPASQALPEQGILSTLSMMMNFMFMTLMMNLFSLFGANSQGMAGLLGNLSNMAGGFPEGSSGSNPGASAVASQASLSPVASNPAENPIVSQSVTHSTAGNPSFYTPVTNPVANIPGGNTIREEISANPGNPNSGFTRQASAARASDATSTMQHLANVAEQNAARMNSRDWCAYGVRIALEQYGVQMPPQGSAYRAAGYMDSHPETYERVEVSREQLHSLAPGHIVVYDRGGTYSSEHGHIYITLGNGRAASDHIENPVYLPDPDQGFAVFKLKEPDTAAQADAGESADTASAAAAPSGGAQSASVDSAESLEETGTAGQTTATGAEAPTKSAETEPAAADETGRTSDADIASTGDNSAAEASADTPADNSSEGPPADAAPETAAEAPADEKPAEPRQ